jgi:ubiquitin carboxyl-terminal hydrolase 34
LNQIYHFLVKFPVYGKLLAAIEDGNTSCTDVFPLGKPFKCLYAIYAIKEHSAAQLKQANITISSIGMIY